MNSLTTYAPGRAELLGNHTDYNEGYVLALAVDRGMTLTGQPRSDRKIRLHSRELGKTQEVALDIAGLRAGRALVALYAGRGRSVSSQRSPGRGLRRRDFQQPADGRGAEQQRRRWKTRPSSFCSRPSAGSSSRMQMARISQKAEHDFVGVRCGLLDQIASLMSKAGHATFIDCRTTEVDHVPLDGKVSVILANSNVKHALVGGEYNERRSDCEAAAHALGVTALRDASTEMLKARKSELADRIYHRALHITGENERVLEGSEALRKGDLARFGELMFASHESSRVNFENSCPELDRLVETARKTPGVYGARLSGGGFGGATINLVETGREEEVVQRPDRRAAQRHLPRDPCRRRCARLRREPLDFGINNPSS